MSDTKWKLVPVEPTEEMIDAGCDLEPVTRYGSNGEVLRERYKAMLDAAPVAPAADARPFQARVQPWMMECFGAEISADRIERNYRFFEEAAELVQANGMTRDEAHQLVDYTFDRPVGELTQEVGGVMVTLAALCLASGTDMHAAGETELARINVPATVAKIRAKQASKPKHSSLPAAPTPKPAVEAHPVEVWHGDRKVTIYADSVLRVWGPHIEEQMSDAPRTLQSVQDAMDWLYAPLEMQSNG